MIYKIAEVNVDMNTRYPRLLKQSEAYISDSTEAQMKIHLSDEFLEKCRKENPHLTLDDCEYRWMGSEFYNNLPVFGGFMLHASAVVHNQKAYLFSAPSGTGKSTHTQLWLKHFDDAYILNDDKPAIRVVGQDIYVYGTPWSGKNDCSRNERVSLGGIAVVRRAKENSIRKLDTEEAVFVLLDQTARTISPIRIASRMDMIDKIVSTGKVYELSCNMDISAAMLSYETMSGKRYCYED